MKARITVLLGALGAVALTLALCFLSVEMHSNKVLKKEVATIVNVQSSFQSPFVVNIPDATKSTKLDVIVLSAKNTLTLRGPVTQQSVAKLEKELLEKSEELSEDDVIYLVLDTPGGSIDAGNKFIDTAHSVPQKIKTLTVFAASMGFQIAENLDERLILPSGTLMSHRAFLGGLEGQIPGEFLTRTNFILQDILEMESRAAARMGLNLKDYQTLVHDEYWVHGADAVQQKAADRPVLARCGKDLMGTRDEIVATFFGPVKVTYSKCPIITGPLAVEVSEMKFSSDAQRVETEKAVTELFNDKTSFVKEYILTNRFEKIFK